jgi:6-pyruvoyltetrahydropterin/6-carboxytetrahydropterin synthase
MVYVTRKSEFSAAHRLYNPNFKDEENKRIFDICNNLHGHGHNYLLEVTVAGEPNKDTGYVIDLKILKKIIDDLIISKVDHKHLNFDVDFLKGIIPTSENLVMKFWEILSPEIFQGKLFSIKLYESDKNYVEYKGE